MSVSAYDKGALTVAEEMENALKVLTLTSHIRNYLEEHDPMALRQGLEALGRLEEARQTSGPRLLPNTPPEPIPWELVEDLYERAAWDVEADHEDYDEYLEIRD